MSGPYRLTADMVSRKLQVVSFCKQYLARWGTSPSYGEVAAAVGINRDHAGKIVKRAIKEGLLHRGTGARRSLADPTASSARLSPAEAHALMERLHAAGYRFRNTNAVGLETTSCPLPLVPELDHIPSGDDGDERDGPADARRAGGHADDYGSGAQAGDRRAA